MTYTNFCLFIFIFSVVTSQAETCIEQDLKVEDTTFQGSVTKASKICDSKNVTSVTRSTFERSVVAGTTSEWLTTTTTTPTHSAPPSSSKNVHGPRNLSPPADRCKPVVVPIQSLPNGTLEDLMSSILPGLIAAFPSHTMVVQFLHVGFAAGLNSSTTGHDTSSPTTNATASATSKSKPLSFADFMDTFSNIVGIITGCIQAWFQFRNLGELRRLFLPRLELLRDLIHLRRLPMIALIAQGQVNPALAIQRPVPAVRPG